MSDSGNNMSEIWQQLLQQTDLRAMSSVIRQLERLIGKDSTTPKQLADVVLQDIALTSRVLIVANSVTLNCKEPVHGESSLTRAIVRVGFNGLRAICISAAIMDSFLKKSPHCKELQAVISQCFNVAVYSRIIARRAGANEEEVFIAGLFQKLGELLFWSSDIPESSSYQDLLKFTVDTPEQAFKRLTGKDFQDLSIALAVNWKLSPLLLESLGATINDNTKAVHLGRRFSSVSRHGWDSPQAKNLLQQHQDMLGVDLETCMRFMREGEAEAKALAGSYVPVTNVNAADNEPNVPVVTSEVNVTQEPQKSEPQKKSTKLKQKIIKNNKSSLIRS